MGGFLLAFCLLGVSMAQGDGLFTGGTDTTYGWTQRRSGDSTTRELVHENRYRGDLDGFLYDARLLRFSLSSEFSQDDRKTRTEGRANDSKGQNRRLRSSLTLFPQNGFPLTLFFSRGNTDSEQDLSSGSETETTEYGLNFSFRERGWYPNLGLQLRRNAIDRTGQSEGNTINDLLNLNLDKGWKWKASALELEYDFQGMSLRGDGPDSRFSSHSLRLDDSIALSPDASLHLGSYLQRWAMKGDSTDSYGGNAAFNFNKAFDPSLRGALGMYASYSHTVTDTTHLSAFGSLSKNKAFSPKLSVDGSLRGHFFHSDTSTSTGEGLQLSLTSRHLPYILTMAGYGLGLGQSEGESSSTHSFNLSLATHAWQRLALGGTASWAMEEGGQERTGADYGLTLDARPLPGVSLMSRAHFTSDETSRRSSREAGGLSRLNPFLPSGAFGLNSSETDPSKTDSFSWNSVLQFQPNPWSNFHIAYVLSNTEDHIRTIGDRFLSGGLNLRFPFLSRLDFGAEFFWDQRKEGVLRGLGNDQERTGLRGRASYVRGRTTFSLDFNFTNLDSAFISDEDQMIFFRVNRDINRMLW